MTYRAPQLGVLKRQQIATLWDKGLDTAEIAFRLNLEEFRVATIISAHVTAKKFSKSVF